jgi:hypothetical protein
MRKQLLYLYLCAVLFLLACGNDQPPVNVAPDAADFEHPKTPEAVVEQYQFYLDNNNFDMAKRLSTPAAKEFLNYLAERIADLPMDSTIMETKFLRIVCREDSNQATCIGIIEEDGEQWELPFNLEKIEGKWYVDTQEEEGELDYDTELLEEFSNDPSQ